MQCVTPSCVVKATFSPAARGRRIQLCLSLRHNGHAHQRVACLASVENDTTSRREVLLNGLQIGVLGSIFPFGAAPRPNGLGVKDYGSLRTLGLCPATKNCVSTAEEANNNEHYIPPWTYNPEEKRGSSKKTQAQAMDELVEVIEATRPDNFEPKIVQRTDSYVYAEYASPTFGFTDDVEFFFPGNDRVEYRSASRIGESDFNINRKRIRALRQALEKKGWESIGF